MHWFAAAYLQSLLVAAIFLNIVCGIQTTVTNGQCNKSNHGKHKLFTNKMGDDQILICMKSDRVYRWKFIDGSPSLGEEFDPAKDCSDIVEHLADAKDDFYWIEMQGGRLEKVWCDVNTDGGGFMLIGMNDSPVLWSLPSNSSVVDPKGPFHLSSVFGNLKILDFAVQVSTKNSFEQTQAHWFYRLKTRRNFGNLLGVGSGGCTDIHSGIGNVAFVKDILTNKVVNRYFRCSKFGPHVDLTLGWGRMNYCFKHNCPEGYAYITGIPIKLGSFGSFSYSARSSLSGVTHNAAAFFGCDNQKCCACFGPKGGTYDYCGPHCKPINGGTVTKQAFVWFWIRTRMPKRVWKRCMEFKLKTNEGNVETHFIDRKTGSARKGSCSNHFHTFLNEGTLSVSDKESLKNIPAVAGLLSYRQDNKQLYVNSGTQWDALSSETEVEKLRRRMKVLEDRTTVSSSCTARKRKYPHLPSGFYDINPEGNPEFSSFKVYCDMTSKNRIGVTMVGHDSEHSTKVSGYESPGSYKRRIVYKGNMADIAALTRLSEHCEQFIRYRCVGSSIRFRNSPPFAWWVSRQGWRKKYWGGGSAYGYNCACRMTNTCAGGRGNNCNCDANDFTMREDSGFLTDKTYLPVTELRFGDTGDSKEYGYHTLGKLKCWG